MNWLENFVLLCAIQAILLSIMLLIAVVAVRQLFRQRTVALVTSGLSSLAVLWLLALVPMSGWLSSYWQQTISEQPQGAVAIDDININVANGIADSDAEVGGLPIAANESVFSQMAKAAWQELQRTDLDNTAGATTVIASWSWKKWIALIILVAILLGLFRLFVAYLTMRQLKSKCTVVTDGSLNERLGVICARLKCRREVAIYETDATSAAFTVGWLKPKIVLGKGWKTWSSDELEATLAHEVAHINSGDFLQRVIAQIAAALNFYNPIVHYLCNLLCIDQEFNADHYASSIVGGRKNYLNTLATMALENDVSNQRLAPMFLPTRKTFFRRIEMLRSKEADRVEGRINRWIGVILATALMIVVAGIRFEEVQAASPGHNASIATGNDQNPSIANMRYVPNDANLVMVVRLAEILKNDSMKKLNQALKPTGTNASQLDQYCEDVFGVKLNDIEQLTIHYTNNNEMGAMGMVVQMSQDGWWAGKDAEEQFTEKLVCNKHVTFRDKPIYLCEKMAWKAMYYTPDDRTLLVASPSQRVLGTELLLKSSIRSTKGPRLNESIVKWNEIAGSRLSIIASDQFLDVTAAAMDARNDVWSPLVRPLMENAQQIVASVDFDDQKLDASAWIYSDATEGGGKSVNQISDSTSVLINLGKTILRGMKENTGKQNAEVKAVSKLMDVCIALLENVEIKNESDHISLTTTVETPGDDLLLPLIPAVAAMNQASARVGAANEMRNLMLAMHNYLSVTGRFPPAVLTSPDGKKYSWRVAVLPYLGRSDLFEKYRFEEDWDSEHNLKLAREIPDEFQHPVSETLGSNFCSYFLVTGQGTSFDGNKGVRIMDIQDGTANTLCIVEAKKEVYWTQPVDIVLADDKLDTDLGGYTPGGFNGSCFDGSTQFLSSEINPKILRLLFLSNDGKAFNWKDVWADLTP